MLLSADFLFDSPQEEIRAPRSSTPLRGTIIDQETRKPLPLVNVVLKDTRYGAATDTMGRFEIRHLPPDLYLVEFRHVAYKTRIHVLNLRPGEQMTVDVEMESQPIELHEVTVTANAAETERTHRAFANTTITAEDISRSGASKLTEVLTSYAHGSSPTISIRGGRRLSPLDRVPFLIYLDGSYVQYIPGAMDFIVDVSQIERIEISRWVGAAPNLGPGTSDRVMQIFTKKAKR